MFAVRRFVVPLSASALVLALAAPALGVVYGSDDRVDVSQESDAALRALATRSTAALVAPWNLRFAAEGTATVEAHHFRPGTSIAAGRVPRSADRRQLRRRADRRRFLADGRALPHTRAELPVVRLRLRLCRGPDRRPRRARPDQVYGCRTVAVSFGARPMLTPTSTTRWSSSTGQWTRAFRP